MVEIKYVVNKSWNLWGLKTRFEWRRGDSPMGRFGGGWNWILGIEIGGSEVILNLLFCMLRISWYDWIRRDLDKDSNEDLDSDSDENLDLDSDSDEDSDQSH